MQAVKVKNEEQGGITRSEQIGAKSPGVRGYARVFARCPAGDEAGYWPSREDVISTTTVVVATVAFFGIFLAVVDWLVQRGVRTCSKFSASERD